MASLTQWTWVWVDSWSWWWTGRLGMLQFMGSQIVRHDWATELNWKRETDVFLTGLLQGVNEKFLRKSVLNIHWKDWCWSWNTNILATWSEELTHLKRPWCWEQLKAGGEGEDRGWDGWMASVTQWIWIWVNSGSWWWTGRPGMLQSMGSQSRTQQSDWTELDAFLYFFCPLFFFYICCKFLIWFLNHGNMFPTLKKSLISFQGSYLSIW